MNSKVRKTLNLEENRIKVVCEINSFDAGYMQGMCRVPPGFNIIFENRSYFGEKYAKNVIHPIKKRLIFLVTRHTKRVVFFSRYALHFFQPFNII
jgi:hypothetical protein